MNESIEPNENVLEISCGSNTVIDIINLLRGRKWKIQIVNHDVFVHVQGEIEMESILNRINALEIGSQFNTN